MIAEGAPTHGGNSRALAGSGSCGGGAGCAKCNGEGASTAGAATPGGGALDDSPRGGGEAAAKAAAAVAWGTLERDLPFDWLDGFIESAGVTKLVCELMRSTLCGRLHRGGACGEGRAAESSGEGGREGGGEGSAPRGAVHGAGEAGPATWPAACNSSLVSAAEGTQLARHLMRKLGEGGAEGGAGGAAALLVAMLKRGDMLRQISHALEAKCMQLAGM